MLIAEAFGLLAEVFAVALLLAWMYMIWIRNRSERLTPMLPSSSGSVSEELVSVIIPARNEEGRIARCLSSVLSQRGVDMEVIVVDDCSSDGTPRIVLERFLSKGVVYVRLSEAADGRNGKALACWRGYKNSSGDWLLFLDADVVLQDDSLVRDTLKYAIGGGVEVLSVVPRLEANTPSSKTLLPTLNNLMHILASPYRTNDPRDKLAFLFGAYILVKRDAYESVGGHMKVSSNLLEDKALGELLKSSGFKIALLDARGRISAVFNETMRQYYNGMLRLFAEYARSSGVGRLVKYLLAAIITLASPLALLLYSLYSQPLSPLAYLSYGIFACMLLLQGLELKRLGSGAFYAPLVVASVASILAALTHTIISYGRGSLRLRWRERMYTISKS